MARQKPEEIKKELQKQEDEVYGDETWGGSNPRPSSDDDVEEELKEVTGDEPIEGEPYSISDAVNEDTPGSTSYTPSDSEKQAEDNE